MNQCQPPWMNDKIKRCLIEQIKLSKLYYKNVQRKEGQGKLEAKAAYSTEQILKLKNDYTPRMANKLNDLNTAPKTFLPILNYFLYSKGIPPVPPLLINGNFVSDFSTKANVFDNFSCVNLYTNKQ